MFTLRVLGLSNISLFQGLHPCIAFCSDKRQVSWLAPHQLVRHRLVCLKQVCQGAPSTVIMSLLPSVQVWIEFIFSWKSILGQLGSMDQSWLRYFHISQLLWLRNIQPAKGNGVQHERLTDTKLCAGFQVVDGEIFPKRYNIINDLEGRSGCCEGRFLTSPVKIVGLDCW